MCCSQKKHHIEFVHRWCILRIPYFRIRYRRFWTLFIDEDIENVWRLNLIPFCCWQWPKQKNFVLKTLKMYIKIPDCESLSTLPHTKTNHEDVHWEPVKKEFSEQEAGFDGEMPPPHRYRVRVVWLPHWFIHRKKWLLLILINIIFMFAVCLWINKDSRVKKRIINNRE